MHIIPVIDVRLGEAVRAVEGDRANYKPLATPFAEGSDPAAVARGMAKTFGFGTFYIADLDGIEGRGANRDLWRRLEAAVPDASLWIDEGIATLAVALAALSDPRITVVVGSETLASVDRLKDIAARIPERVVLSLDFSGETFAGPKDVLDDPALWPESVIVMTLARVGSTHGPDLARIAEIAAKAGSSRRVYAAGGVRNKADLIAAHEAGAHGALIASALHAKNIEAGDLSEVAGL